MTSEDIKEFYKRQVKFYEKEVKFDSELITLLNKQMKRDKERYGFETLDYKAWKKERAKYYRERAANKLKVVKYTKLASQL